jgi:hypothetical protein
MQTSESRWVAHASRAQSPTRFSQHAQTALATRLRATRTLACIPSRSFPPQAAEAAQAKSQRELDASERRLADATQRLGTSAKHANQLRALQAHVAELNERLEKKTALAERLLKRHGPSAAEPPSRAAPAAEAADVSTPRVSAALRRERAADPPSATRSGDKENDENAALPPTTRSSSRARGGLLTRPAAAEPGRRASGFVVGTVPRRASGSLVMPARQSERSVLTPRAPKTPCVADSPLLTDGKGSAQHATDVADPPAPSEVGRRKSGVKVVPSRYLDTANITTRSR